MNKSIEQRGPDFIGIGVPKSGSTWFMRVLSQHPNIFTTAKKEPHFFKSDELYSKGLENYYKLYKDAKSYQKAGEFSTKYIYSAEKSSHRIKKHFPEVKLICILRDPLKRSISHYQWLKQLGILNSQVSLKDAIECNKGIINFSKYSKGIQIFLNDFNKDNILFLKTEDLKNHENLVFKSVENFLEINGFNFNTKNIAKSETFNPKYRFFENLRKRIHKTIRINDQDWILNTKLATSFSKLYRKFNSNKVKKNKISLDDKKLLQGYFADDLSNLNKLIDLDIKNWNKI